MINQITIQGNVTKEIDVKNSSDGNWFIVTMSIAYNEGKKVNTEWINFVSYFDVKWILKSNDRNSDLLAKINKGSGLVVSGKLEQNRWKDKDGNNRNKVNIMANDVVIMNNTSSSSNDNDDDIPF